MTFKATIREYYRLTKPGIIRGNLITASAGFFLASQQDIDPQLYLAMLVGLGFIIAAACVSNNYLDRGIDRKMARTADRALVSGVISGRHALIFAAALGTLGVIILTAETTILALVLALFGYVAYVFLYGYYKRRSTLSTAAGSISGALPPVVGYTAITNQIDLAAILLFVVLAAWQMPHFFAIAIYRLKDYAAAGLPVLPVIKGIEATRRQMLSYIVAYIAASIALTFFGYTGIAYAVLMAAIGAVWFFVTLKKPVAGKEIPWAKTVFFVSLAAITLQSIAITVDAVLT